MPLDLAPTLDQLAQRAAEAFQQRFGRQPQVVAAAPGRVNLIGEHTDYNDGFVLPMAIDRYTVFAADRAPNDRSVFASATMDDSIAELSPTGEPLGDQPSWAKYVSSLLSVYSESSLAPPAIEAVIDSTVPLGGGLSSSAALEVALATLVEYLGGFAVDPAQKALYCQAAEHRAGVPCGIMDQFSSALCQANHVMLLDCRDQSRTMQPFNDPEVAVLITNSNVRHELTGGEYAERRTQCEEAAVQLGVDSLRDATELDLERLDGVWLQRARHVVGEIARTPRAARAMADCQWEEAGELMVASHVSLRDDYQVSCPELDALVDAALEVGLDGGVYGSRMTGGGFGGCTVSLVQTSNAESAAEAIAKRYHETTGKQSTQFITRPSQGAHIC